jgi:histidyl-tRNA synthetase
MPEIAAPKGTRDILPADAAAWRWLLEAHRQVAESFGYRPIETPVFEATELFARGVGEETDIVEKQMFTFEDRGGRSLALRPESTAGAVRAVVGARLDQERRPVRVHYQGPMFRAENPQRGRQHQFTQLGVECMGERSPQLDAEVIEVAWRYFQALQLHGLRLQVNTLGNVEDRRQYRRALIDYYTPLRDQLCDACKRRLEVNPLRLLDCKNDERFVEHAPVMWDLLDSESQAFFNLVLQSLEAAHIEFTVNYRIVRGLDYYVDTVFEIWHDSLQGAQNSLGGGGRYDGLAELLGFPATPGTGYALGVERILLIAQELGRAPAPEPDCDVVVLSLETAQAAAAADLARTLRKRGVSVIVDASDRRLDRKLRNADRVAARVAVILGEEEVNKEQATVRDLAARDEQRVPVGDVTSHIARILEQQA